MPRIRPFPVGGVRAAVKRAGVKRAASGDEEILGWCRDVVSRVSALEPEMSALNDGGLLGLTSSFRARLRQGEGLDSLLPEAFAAVREAATRALRQRPFDVQVMGAAVLHRGLIAEMATGEGKTLTGTLAAYLNALPGAGVHIMTANDYLAKRDREWMSPVFGLLGLRTGLLDPAYTYPDQLGARLTAYAADVTYGPWAEFGYDYLRDNSAWSPAERVQRGLHCALVDEADLILIDEMRSAMFISGPGDEPDTRIADCARIVAGLTSGVHYEVDERVRTAELTDEGTSYVEAAFGIDSLYDQANHALLRHLRNALTASELYLADRDYLVEGGVVVPIDSASGRPHPGRRFGDGFHQALEAKEGLQVSIESQTLATIGMSDYVSLYERFAGMTGVGQPDLETYRRIYQRTVVPIATNRPVIRVDHPDLVFPARGDKLAALADDVAVRHAAGQPVLVGVASIEEAAEVSRLLTARQIDHEVLTARNHASEAQSLAQAAQLGAVTVVSKMAGRGVDIILGGPDGAGREAVCDVGGLYVLGTERSVRRRPEQHLRGRAGRQGDPGESRFYLSFDDDIVKAFVLPKMRSVAAKSVLGGAPFQRLSLAIDGAQRNYAIQAASALVDAVEYDAVLAEQQHKFYAERREVVDQPDVSDRIGEIIDEVVREQAAPADARDAYARMEAEIGPALLREAERKVFLSVTDAAWRAHLQEMAALLEGIGLRAIGGRSPLVEYRREAADLFARLRFQIKVSTVAALFTVQIGSTPPDE
jgi:preprotein translocase subunit SecA